MDLGFLVWMQTFFGPETRTVWLLITNLISVPSLLFVLGVLFWQGRTRIGLRLTIAVLTSVVVIDLLKIFWLQPRPYYVHEQVQAWRASTGFGMPSGHAAIAMSLGGTFALSVRKRWIAAGAMALILLVSMSRVYFGVHFPFQVLAGLGVGLLVLAVIFRWEAQALSTFKSMNVSSQLRLAITVTLLVVSLKTAIIWARTSQFGVPAAWAERHHQAQLYETALAGNRASELEPLSLFSSIGMEQLGACLGVWLVLIYAGRREHHGQFTTRQQIANISLGVLIVGALLSLRHVIRESTVAIVTLWITIPFVLSIAVPRGGAWICQQLDRHP